MALDFTVIITVRQRFGDDQLDEKPSLKESERGLETDAPFVGAEKSFPFRCPGVNPAQQAVLLFQCQGVSIRNQHLEINGQLIHGGIPASIDRDSDQRASGEYHLLHARWHGNVMLVEPGVLRENNVLLIRAAEMTAGNIDDFVVDNAVVLFKTRGGVGGVGLPTGVGASTSARKKRKPAKRRPARKAVRPVRRKR